MAKSLHYIEQRDYYGIEHLASAFGGMGSFNDLVIAKVNGNKVSDAEYVAVNDRLDRLRTEMYELVQYIRRNHEIRE